MDRLLEATYRVEQQHFWWKGLRGFVRPLVGGRDCRAASRAHSGLRLRDRRQPHHARRVRPSVGLRRVVSRPRARPRVRTAARGAGVDCPNAVRRRRLRSRDRLRRALQPERRGRGRGAVGNPPRAQARGHAHRQRRGAQDPARQPFGVRRRGAAVDAPPPAPPRLASAGFARDAADLLERHSVSADARPCAPASA